MVELAKDYLRRAEIRIKSAELAYSEGYFPDVVRFSQEAVELSLKAALRSVGIEYPKVHDVGRVLRVARNRFPTWFREEIDRLSEISFILASKRAPSMYGVEVSGKPPSGLFDRDDAEEALSSARYVFNVTRRLLSEVSGD